MFKSFFSHKHAGRILSAFMMLLTAAFVFSTVSCRQPSGSDSSTSADIYGTWISSYSEYFVIDPGAATLTNYYGSTDATAECYAGSDIVINKSSDTAGIIYIKYARAWDSSSNSYSESAADVGKWYAVSYKELTSSSVSLSAAYGSASSEDTLEDAESEFTISKGYFTSYSECVKK